MGTQPNGVTYQNQQVENEIMITVPQHLWNEMVNKVNALVTEKQCLSEEHTAVY